MIQDYGIINDRAPHLVADLCEIISYFEDVEVSRSDIETYLFERGGKGLFSELELADPDSAEANEEFQKLSEDVFRHFRYRATAFGAYYPFVVRGDLLFPVETITQRHKIYAALLAFSRLKMFSRAEQIQFARSFEELCVEAAVGFAANWEVVHFGTGGRDRQKYGNKLKNALIRLSEVIREIPIRQEIASLEENNVGDGGVDIIIFRKWSDPARAVPYYFAQCAAQQKTWPGKKYEASPLEHRKYFSFFHEPGVIMFIPLCYRSVDGCWIDSKGHQTILVDRKRLLDLIDGRLKEAKQQFHILEKIPKPFDLGCAMNSQ